MEKFKQWMQIILGFAMGFSVVIWGIVGLIMVVMLLELKPNISKAIKNLEQMTVNMQQATSQLPVAVSNLKDASNSVKIAGEKFKELSEAQYKELNDPQAIRSRRLLYQSGDNIYRLILSLNSSAELIKKDTIPNINNATIALTRTLNTTDKTIDNLGKSLDNTLVKHQELVTQAQLILLTSQPEIERSLTELANSLSSTNILLKDADIAVKDFDEAFPKILQFIISTGGNIAGITEEIHKLGVSFNKQDPKIIRAIKFIIQAGITGLINGTFRR